MSFQHKDLAAGRWGELSFSEQMANIGSEVERVFSWRSRHNADYAKKAAERTLELFDLTIENNKIPAHFKEIARARESLADYFFGSNQFMSDESSWRNYFSQFTYSVCKNR
jgi:hypothetical protein